MAGKGRPSKIDIIKDNVEKIKEWKKLGATDEQICKQLNVGESTFYKWLSRHPELKEEIQVGTDFFIFELKNELARKAFKHTLETKKQYIKVDMETGHKTQYTEITTKEVDGDTGALHLLLKNLDRGRTWSENWQNYELKKQELELRKQIAEDKLF
jgi:hypothetical protein